MLKVHKLRTNQKWNGDSKEAHGLQGNLVAQGQCLCGVKVPWNLNTEYETKPESY